MVFRMKLWYPHEDILKDTCRTNVDPFKGSLLGETDYFMYPK